MFKQFIGKFYQQNLRCRRVTPKNGAKNKMQLKAFNIAIMAVCAALYAVIGILTSFGLTFGGVAFWPAAFIPAIFAVLFGPYEGGFGAAIGIFIHDTIINGQPLLSLAVGVPANFIAFFLIGYLAHKKFDNKKTIISLIVGFVVILAGLLLPIIIYPTNLIGFAFSTTTVEILFAALMIVSFALFIGIAKFSKEFRSFAVGSVIGMSIGALIIAFGVWAWSQIFFGSNQFYAAQFTGPFASAVFVWTFVTEAPFVLLLVPPIVKAVSRAFPFLRQKLERQEQANR